MARLFLFGTVAANINLINLMIIYPVQFFTHVRILRLSDGSESDDSDQQTASQALCIRAPSVFLTLLCISSTVTRLVSILKTMIYI